MPSFAEVVAFLIKKHGENESNISRRLGFKKDGKPRFSSQLIGQYKNGKVGKKGVNPDFVEAWKAEFGEDILGLMKAENLSTEREFESGVKEAETLHGRIPAPDMYQIVVDTMQHILNQNTKLIESREADIQKLHEDKQKIYKEKEWMYTHIDQLTSKISGPQEPKK